MVMVRLPVVLALIVSLGVCGVSEMRARQKYAQTQHQIELRNAELQKLADIDQQLQAFQKRKAELQRRIDLLEQLYTTTAQRSAH